MTSSPDKLFISIFYMNAFQESPNYWKMVVGAKKVIFQFSEKLYNVDMLKYS